MMKTIVLLVLGALLSSCSGKTGAPSDQKTRLGPEAEKKAVAVIEQLARAHGHHLAKMKLQVRTDQDTDHFLVFLFPLKKDGKTFDSANGLFAIVDARTDQVIRFSDPVWDARHAH